MLTVTVIHISISSDTEAISIAELCFCCVMQYFPAVQVIRHVMTACTVRLCTARDANDFWDQRGGSLLLPIRHNYPTVARNKHWSPAAS